MDYSKLIDAVLITLAILIVCKVIREIVLFFVRMFRHTSQEQPAIRIYSKARNVGWRGGYHVDFIPRKKK